MKHSTKSVRFEIEATTNLVPYMATKETFVNYEEAIKRRCELKRLYHYVSLTEVTETRKTMRNATED